MHGYDISAHADLYPAHGIHHAPFQSQKGTAWRYGECIRILSIRVFAESADNKAIFQLPDELMYKANVAVGWLSPLNQATYHMHNFGYDLLPRLWQTYLIFGGLIAVCFFFSLRAARSYNFNFSGTEG